MYLTKPKRPGVKVERIYRLLLDHPLKDMTSYRLAKGSCSDHHWTLDKVRELQKLGVMKGMKVVRPKDLFLIWANRPTDIRSREYFVKDVLGKIKGSKMEYAATTYFGENQIGRYLFPSRMDIYIRFEDASKWHMDLVRDGLVGKGNLRLMITDEHVFFNPFTRGEIKTVSVQQLIVDLLREGGVCNEAAELLMERFYGEE